MLTDICGPRILPFHFCFHQNTNPQHNFQCQNSSNSLVSQIFRAAVGSLMDICSRSRVTQLALLVLLCFLLCCSCFLPGCPLVLLFFLLCCFLSCFLSCFISFGLSLCLGNRTIFCYNASCCRLLVIGSQVLPSKHPQVILTGTPLSFLRPIAGACDTLCRSSIAFVVGGQNVEASLVSLDVAVGAFHGGLRGLCHVLEADRTISIGQEANIAFRNCFSG